jgi:hypothetical protein
MTAKIRTFEDLIVWQRSIALVKRVYVITDEGGLKRDFGLKDQLRRAALFRQILRRGLSVHHARNTFSFSTLQKVLRAR